MSASLWSSVHVSEAAAGGADTRVAKVGCIFTERRTLALTWDPESRLSNRNHFFCWVSYFWGQFKPYLYHLRDLLFGIWLQNFSVTKPQTHCHILGFFSCWQKAYFHLSCLPVCMGLYIACISGISGLCLPFSCLLYSLLYWCECPGERCLLKPWIYQKENINELPPSVTWGIKDVLQNKHG